MALDYAESTLEDVWAEARNASAASEIKPHTDYQRDPITQNSKMYSTLGPVFEGIEKSRLKAEYDGKRFKVDLGSGGVVQPYT